MVWTWDGRRPRLAARACSMSDLNTSMTAASNSWVKSIWRMNCKSRVRPGSRAGLETGGDGGLGGGEGTAAMEDEFA